MPLYEYQCDRCTYKFDTFQSITDKPLTDCNKCSGTLQKVISTSPFHFKGSGFHTTDYDHKTSK